MADKYIDCSECIEYGEHLVRAARELVGTSRFVDVEALIEAVSEAVADVEAKRRAASMEQSGARGGRAHTAGSAAAARDVLARFFSYLHSLPRDTRCDVEAFFPGGMRGEISRLKPADLLAKVAEVQRGFSVPRNAALPGSDAWQHELAHAHDALAAAVSLKSNAGTQASRATSELAAARTRFLVIYGLAKRLIRACLDELDRSSEYRLFFLDLQVNETSRAPANGPHTTA